MEARKPTRKQIRFIKSQKLPVPPTFKQASAVVGYILQCPEEKRGECIRGLREHVSLLGSLVQVKKKDKEPYTGTVVELVVRVPERRGHILRAIGGASPFLYEAVVESSEDKKRRHESLSSLRKIEVKKKAILCQKLLFD